VHFQAVSLFWITVGVLNMSRFVQFHIRTCVLISSDFAIVYLRNTNDDDDDGNKNIRDSIQRVLTALTISK